MIQTQLAELLEKEMSRREFLATLGFGVASILGFSSIVKLLTGKSSTTTHTTQITNGYGSRPYGN